VTREARCGSGSSRPLYDCGGEAGSPAEVLDHFREQVDDWGDGGRLPPIPPA
jgi:hypothetical protein